MKYASIKYLSKLNLKFLVTLLNSLFHEISELAYGEYNIFR